MIVQVCFIRPDTTLSKRLVRFNCLYTDVIRRKILKGANWLIFVWSLLLAVTTRLATINVMAGFALVILVLKKLVDDEKSVKRFDTPYDLYDFAVFKNHKVN